MFRRARTYSAGTPGSDTPKTPSASSRPNSPLPLSPTTPTALKAAGRQYSEVLNEKPTKWDDPRNDAVHRCVPPLTSSCHKGSSGRVGVLGGSAQYTGAPYYAAMASLKVGADLAFVFCAEEAAIPIKCYSPELMVAPVYNAAEFDKILAQEKNMCEALAKIRVEGMESVVQNSLDGMLKNVTSFDDNLEKVVDKTEESAAKLKEIRQEQQRLVDAMVASVANSFDRLHVLIIGPGLGRCPLVLKATAKIIELAKERNIPMVIDADGLFLLTQEPYAALVSGYKGLVLTPNAMEIKRLTQSMEVNYKKVAGWEGGGEKDAMNDFEKATDGAVIVKKGPQDIIFSTVQEANFQDRDLRVTRNSMLCNEVGGLKRSGGIGDILSGCIGTFVAWNRILSREKSGRDFNQDDLLLACWSACCITKRATRHAFEKKRRSMTAPDVLAEIGGAVDEMTGTSIAHE